jgi:hypothetical protein
MSGCLWQSDKYWQNMDPQPQALEWEPNLSPTLLSDSSSRRRDHQPSLYPPYPCLAVIPYPHALHAMSTADISLSPERIVQPPRPPNAWILYRSDKLRQLPPTEPGNPRRAQAEVSKMISNMWKNESEAVRNEYERRADAKKAEHQQMYPNYRFQPMKKEEKERMRTEKRSEKEKERTQSRKTRHRSHVPYIASSIAASMPSMIPLYNPEAHFGPTGPSPPMSAASSPEDDSPLREAQTALGDSSSSYLPTASPTPVSPNPHSPGSSSPRRNPKHVVVPRPPLSPQQWSVQPSRSSSSASSVRTSPTRSSEKSSQKHSEKGNEGVRTQCMIHSTSQMAHNCVPFVLQGMPYDVSVFPPHPSAEWSSDDLSSLQALLSVTDDPSIFELSNISPELLLAHPTGQIEVSMGTDLLPFEPSSSDYTAFTQDFFGAFDLPEPNSSSHSSADFASPLSSPDVAGTASKAPSTVPSGGDGSDLLSLFSSEEDQRSLGGAGAEMLEYFNFEPQYAQTAGPPPACPQPPVHKPALTPLMESKEPNVATSCYSSANAKTMRRSAVPWKQKFPEENPPLEPSLSRWGVSAR